MPAGHAIIDAKVKIWSLAPIIDADNDQDPDARRHLCTTSLHNGMTELANLRLNIAQHYMGLILEQMFMATPLYPLDLVRSGAVRKVVQRRRQISGNWIRRYDRNDMAIGQVIMSQRLIAIGGT